MGPQSLLRVVEIQARARARDARAEIEGAARAAARFAGDHSTELGAALLGIGGAAILAGTLAARAAPKEPVVVAPVAPVPARTGAAASDVALPFSNAASLDSPAPAVSELGGNSALLYSASSFVRNESLIETSVVLPDTAKVGNVVVPKHDLAPELVPETGVGAPVGAPLAENIAARDDELRQQEAKAAKAARKREEAEKKNAEIDEYLREKSDDLNAAYAFLGVTMGKETSPLAAEAKAVDAAMKKTLNRNHPSRNNDDSSSYNLTLAHYKVILRSTRMESAGLKQYAKLYVEFDETKYDTLRRGAYASWGKVVLPRGFV